MKLQNRIKLIPVALVFFMTGCSTKPNPVTAPSPSPGSETSESRIINEFDDIDRVYYKKALTALYDDDLDKAETILIQLIDSNPDFAGPQANLALVYYKKGAYKKAKNEIKKTLELNPDLPEALNLSGMLEIEDGNIQQARELYLKALVLNDEYANAHHNIALLYDIYFQDIEKAIYHYQRYLELTKTGGRETQDWLEHLKASLKAKG